MLLSSLLLTPLVILLLFIVLVYKLIYHNFRYNYKHTSLILKSNVSKISIIISMSIATSYINVSFIDLDVLLNSINSLVTINLSDSFNFSSINFFSNFGKFNGMNIPFIPEYLPKSFTFSEIINNSSGIIQGRLPYYLGTHYTGFPSHYKKWFFLAISSSLIIPFVGLGGRFLGNSLDTFKKYSPKIKNFLFWDFLSNLLAENWRRITVNPVVTDLVERTLRGREIINQRISEISTNATTQNIRINLLTLERFLLFIEVYLEYLKGNSSNSFTIDLSRLAILEWQDNSIINTIDIQEWYLRGLGGNLIGNVLLEASAIRTGWPSLINELNQDLPALRLLEQDLHSLAEEYSITLDGTEAAPFSFLFQNKLEELINRYNNVFRTN